MDFPIEDNVITKRYKRTVNSWFDFILATSEKRALSENFIGTISMLITAYPSLESALVLVRENPLGKYQISDAIVYLFLRSRSGGSDRLVQARVIIADGFLKKEIDEFLQHLRDACRQR